jgi:hypothetical protein
MSFGPIGVGAVRRRALILDEFLEAIDMKTILVPMENSETMQSALETALLLGRRNNAYIEGFALRWPIIVAGLDMVGGLALDSLEQDNLERGKESTAVF